MTNTLKKIHSSLHLNELEFDVYLGWPDVEREQKQKIMVDIELHFFQLPHACITDDLKDTHCYDELIKKINQYLTNRSFRLIEYLGKELYQFIKDQFSKQDVSVSICISKKPPIANLIGSVSFRYGEEAAWSF